MRLRGIPTGLRAPAGDAPAGDAPAWDAPAGHSYGSGMRLLGMRLPGIPTGQVPPTAQSLFPHKLRQVAGGEGLHVAGDELGGPIPPLEAEELGDFVVGESLFDGLGGVSAHEGVGCYVAGDHCHGADDGSVADAHARHDGGFVADPHVIADDGVALAGIFLAIHGAFPSVLKNGKRIGGNRVGEVVGPIHDEGGAGGDHAEFTDDELVTREFEMIFHILLEVVNILKIIVIGVVAHLNVGAGDDIVEKTKSVVMKKRKRCLWVGSSHKRWVRNDVIRQGVCLRVAEAEG